MHEMFLAKKKGTSYYDDGAVLAMDFEGPSWYDLANPNRTFGVTGPGASLSKLNKINGEQSYFQEQYNTAAAGCLYTPLTQDLIFYGDFWAEVWGYCLGQGNSVYTGNGNQILSCGVYTSNPGLFIWGLQDLKPYVSIPNMYGGHTQILIGNITIANNAWYHLAIGRKDGIIYLFVNGKLAGTVAHSPGIGHGANLCIGGYFDGRINNMAYSAFNGYLDRLRIYQKCLTTTEFTPIK